MFIFTVSCSIHTVKAFEYLFALFFGYFITVINNRKLCKAMHLCKSEIHNVPVCTVTDSVGPIRCA